MILGESREGGGVQKLGKQLSLLLLLVYRITSHLLNP